MASAVSPDLEEVAVSMEVPELRRSWDVVVVGAGPAGAMVAREVALGGGNVLLLDRDEFPRWKVCGACLSPGAQDALRRSGLGALPGQLGAESLAFLTLRGWGRTARIPLRGTLALSRWALDKALVQAAIEAGSAFLPGTRARWLEGTEEAARLRVDHSNDSSEITAKVVIAADGLRSGLLAGAGLRTGPAPSHARGRVKIGLGAVIREEGAQYGPGEIHMMVDPQGYVGVVRTEDGLLNVAAALNRSALTESGSPAELIRRVLARAGGPALKGEVLAGWKGTPALGYRPYRLGGRRILAVGDAAGFVEPFTGEGMGWALAGARALAPLVQEAVEGWNPEVPGHWEEIYSRTVLPAQRLSRSLAWTLGRPLSARILLEFLTHLPGMAGPFVQRAANPPSLHSIPAGSTH